MELWKKYIQWEKSNPLQTEDYSLYAKRGINDTLALLLPSATCSSCATSIYTVRLPLINSLAKHKKCKNDVLLMFFLSFRGLIEYFFFCT